MSFFVWLANLAYFMAPAYFANMAPVLSRVLKKNLPLDFNIKFNDKRLLGSHKTLFGSIFGVIAAIIIAFIQNLIFVKTNFGLINYSNWPQIGLLFGFGAIFGDALKSFFKRRLNFKPGSRWFPLDQIDFVVGALAFISFIYFPGWIESIAILLVSVLGHIIVNHCAFYLGIRKEKW